MGLRASAQKSNQQKQSNVAPSSSTTATPSPAPKSYSQIEHECAQKITSKIIIPTLVDNRNRYEEEMLQTVQCSQEAPTSDTVEATTVVGSTATVEPAQTTVRRTVLFLDGEFYQLSSLIGLQDTFLSQFIEIIKFPSACSMDFQPNDVMPSFMVLKRCISSGDYRKKAFGNASGLRLVQDFEPIIKQLGIDSASRNTFLLSIQLKWITISALVDKDALFECVTRRHA